MGVYADERGPRPKTRGSSQEEKDLCKAFSDEIVRKMVLYCISEAALQRRSNLPMVTIRRAINGSPMSPAIYQGLLSNLEEIRNADAR